MAVLSGDITANLQSLSFDAGLNAEERDILYVRKRSHAVRTCMIGQACYLVAIINEGKRLIYEQESLKTKKACPKPWKEVPKRRPLKIGILGCGAIGKSLVENFQKYSDIHAEEILISTRRPENLSEFSEVGIRCFFDNKKLVESTDLTFMCCLPSQIDSVIEDIKGSIRCLLYTFVAGIPRIKLCKLLENSNIIKPEFIFGGKEVTKKSPWNYKQSISQALENSSLCEVICPGSKDDAIIRTTSKLSELMIYVLINMLVVNGYSKNEVTKYVNLVAFGPPTDEKSTSITEDDLWHDDVSSILCPITVNERTFQIFDLDKLHSFTTKIGSILESDNNVLATRFRKRHVSLFDKFNSWKVQCELV
ncbi:NADP-dependent oxidoreductase domain-containing protein 1-like [Rhopilema esculentum]|uniref:NADP-dependent oxidoreductase domain-containing protein 1-like n=1 Tax=Rhopilema esculentum TaxID=499914 RepID=UPI0031D42F82